MLTRSKSTGYVCEAHSNESSALLGPLPSGCDFMPSVQDKSKMLDLVLEITSANDVADAKFAVHHRLLKA